MAKFQIRSPEGKSYEVNAPAGATQEQVMAYAKSTFGAPTPAKPRAPAPAPEMTTAADMPQDTTEAEEAPWYKKAALGSAVGTIETYQGLKDLFGGEITDNDKLALDMMRKDADAAGGWATAGNVASEVAQLAMPMSMAAKGVKAAKMGKAVNAAKVAKQTGTVKNLRKAKAAKEALQGKKAMLAAEAAVAGLHGAAKIPETGESRTGNAAKNVVGAGLGMGASKLAASAVKGVARTPAAQRLMDMGTELTPAKASNSGLPQTLEYIMGITPFLARGTKEIQEEGIESMNLAVLKRAALDPKKVTQAGADGVAQAKKTFTDGYAKAWAAGGKPAVAKLNEMSNDILGASRDLGTASMPVLKKAYLDIAKIHKDYSPKGVQALDNSLRKSIKKAAVSGDEGLEITLQKLRDDLRDSVGGDARQLLKEADSKYGDYLVVQNAAGTKRAMDAGGVFDSNDFMGGVKATGNKSRNATGRSPSYALAGDVAETLGKKTPNPIMSFIRGAAVKAPSPTGVLRKGGDVMLGNTSTQKFLQKGYNPTAEALRQLGITGANIGASLEDN